MAAVARVIEEAAQEAESGQNPVVRLVSQRKPHGRLFEPVAEKSLHAYLDTLAEGFATAHRATLAVSELVVPYGVIDLAVLIDPVRLRCCKRPCYRVHVRKGCRRIVVQVAKCFDPVSDIVRGGN